MSLQNENGATCIEYAMLTALIALASLLSLGSVGSSAAQAFELLEMNPPTNIQRPNGLAGGPPSIANNGSGNPSDGGSGSL